VENSLFDQAFWAAESDRQQTSDWAQPNSTSEVLLVGSASCGRAWPIIKNIVFISHKASFNIKKNKTSIIKMCAPHVNKV